MPSYSTSSRTRLRTAHNFLQELFNIIIEDYDNTIIQAHRSLEEQMEYYLAKKSKVKSGKHNIVPSEAVDSAPYIAGVGIPWPKMPKSTDEWLDREYRKAYIKSLCQFYHYGGWVEATAREHGIHLRWGGDWDRDHNVNDQNFNDLVHFELIWMQRKLDG